MTRDVLSLVREWLERGSVDSERIEDVPWSVEEVGEGDERRLVAANPLFPVPLFVFYNRDLEVLRLVIETGIKTWILEVEKRLKYYRFLLRLNTMPLVKTYVFGDEDEIAIVGDLSTKSLGEQEFNDMLAFMLSAAMSLYSELGMPGEVKEESLLVLSSILYKWLKEGWSESKLVRLLERGGMKKEEAEKLVEEIKEVLEKSGKRGGEVGDISFI